ncbi:uncharacterized protein FSUBG_6141 [Fusarium subglutinans]|uniref:Uncharacterized protein n=1 Tax=Gibberella subglutinans TaxID=42677 RepID=A0A8H5Q299_GIBSU|nr:uncharacterized protein FSUBG_6141 [Fusarium subglutinans]KAF5606308.1 hypothetical protein FSUBG_6141 [Fusarium subglutinans]
MDEPKKGDKNIGAKAWDAAIAKIEGNLEVETRQPQKKPSSPLNELALKVDNNMVAGDMRLCARQIQRYYHAEGENPQKDCIKPADLARAAKLQPIFALEACEEGEIRGHRKNIPLSKRKSTWSLTTHAPRALSAPTVTIPQETNPWQDTGTDVAHSSEPLPHDRPEAQYHHAYARSWPPGLEDQSFLSDQFDPILELYEDSQPSPRRKFAAPPWDVRRNQREGEGIRPHPAGHSISQHEQAAWKEEEELLSFASDEFKPFQGWRNDGYVLQTDHDVEELLTPENFAKYKRYRRREKRAGRA